MEIIFVSWVESFKLHDLHSHEICKEDEIDLVTALLKLSN